MPEGGRLAAGVTVALPHTEPEEEEEEEEEIGLGLATPNDSYVLFGMASRRYSRSRSAFSPTRKSARERSASAVSSRRENAAWARTTRAAKESSTWGPRNLQIESKV